MKQSIIYVPQLPINMRYQEWHLVDYLKEFNNKFTTKTLGLNFISNIEKLKPDETLFSSYRNSINLELEQIKEMISIDINSKDILYLSDLSYPGFFTNILYHKKIRSFCYCHATSLNKYDIFSENVDSKSLVEKGHNKLFEKVFVGSSYHAKKLSNNGWKNIEVLGLPIPLFETYQENKIYDIVSVARETPQKIDYELEGSLKKDGIEIKRKEHKTWEEYYKFLSQSKILLITSNEDTFNYSVMEAILNNTIVLAPNRCSFPELLDRDYIYNDYNELKEKILYYLLNSDKVPKLKNIKLCENFYNNLFSYME